MKKILIAGGAGFIGTRFCNENKDNYDITVVDHFWFGDHLDKKIKKIVNHYKSKINVEKIKFKVVLKKINL